MSTIQPSAAAPDNSPGFLSRERIIAGQTFNRWLVPPAALAIHLCIGMAYGFSVFWLPMSRLVPGADAACANQGFAAELFTTTCNWSVPSVTHIFEIFIAVLGLSAATWGGWLERAGPRKAGFIAALCWGGGLVLAGLATSLHQLWLVYLVAVLCGIGQGLGYITPVSTLIKWFPDRRGMATGFAIMGYGGGAMIGAPLAVWLMAKFTRDGVPGVSLTLVCMGLIYFVVMCVGAFGFRVAPVGWRPAGWGAGDRRHDSDDHPAPRSPAPGLAHPAILADLGCSASQRHRRHRGDRDGEPDAAGRVRRAAARHRCRHGTHAGPERCGRGRRRRACGADQPLQQHRAHLLGLAVRQAWGARTPTSSSSSSGSLSIACCRPGGTWVSHSSSSLPSA